MVESGKSARQDMVSFLYPSHNPFWNVTLGLWYAIICNEILPCKRSKDKSRYYNKRIVPFNNSHSQFLEEGKIYIFLPFIQNRVIFTVFFPKDNSVHFFSILPILFLPSKMLLEVSITIFFVAHQEEITE